MSPAADVLTLATDRVYVYDVGDPGDGAYLISSSFADGRLGHLQVTTRKAWIAALCERAKLLHLVVVVTWTEGRVRGFRNLVRASLEPQQPESAA